MRASSNWACGLPFCAFCSKSSKLAGLVIEGEFVLGMAISYHSALIFLVGGYGFFILRV